MSSFKNFKRGIVYKAILTASAFINIIPRKTALFIGAMLGNLFYVFSVKDRFRVQRNLYLAFGSKLGHRQRNVLARKSLINMGQMAIDVIRMKRHYPNLKDYIDVEGMEYFDNAYKRGKGIIITTGHNGNFELMAVHMSQLGYKVGAIGRELYDTRLDQFIRNTREGMNVTMFDTTLSPRKMVRWLKEGGALAVLMDTDSFRVRSTFIPAFGRLSHTPVGQSVLGLRTGAAFVPVYCLRRNNRYLLKVYPEVTIEPSGDFDKDVYNITKKCTEIWEQTVIENMDQWIWMHNRWLNRPEEPKEYIEEMA